LIPTAFVISRVCFATFTKAGIVVSPVRKIAMKRFVIPTMCLLSLTMTGCRLFHRSCDDRDSRDDRYGSCDRATSRSNTTAACSTAGSSFGQPMMQGSVVGTVPGYTSTPMMGTYQGEGDLPYPQPTIQNPGVPSTAPVASIPGPSFVQKPGR
jgi:hypothetical protein